MVGTFAAVACIGTVAATLTTAAPASAVDTPITIDLATVTFGEVEVASTSQVSVTLTNTGTAPFGPINMFGGAPAAPQFGASQNCQATTLAPGGSCQIGYSFTPDGIGPFTDTSRFTVSATNSQNDGEDFEVALSGTGCQTPACTQATTSTSTTTPAPGLEPTPAVGPPMAPPGQSPVPAEAQPPPIPAGQSPQTTSGDDAAAATDDTAGEATSLQEGTPTEGERAQAEVDESDDTGTNWILPAVTLLVVVLLAAGAIVLAYRAGRSAAASRPDEPPTDRRG